MIIVYFACVVLYYLFGYLFLPDSICGTAGYILGAFAFPFVLLIIVGAILKKTGYEPPQPKPKPIKQSNTPKDSDEGQTYGWCDTCNVWCPGFGGWCSELGGWCSKGKPRHGEEVMRRVDGFDGHEFELWCADLLRRAGYMNVAVTAQSGDQGVDITAEKEGVRYAFQCKCYSSDLGNHPVQEVHAGKALYGCHVGVVMTNRFFTAGAKELAKATSVLLWDRDKLMAILGQIEEK